MLWLLGQPSLINARRWAVLPVFRCQRLQLADALGRQLQALGLERHQPKPAELGEYLAKYRPARQQAAAPAPPAPGVRACPPSSAATVSGSAGTCSTG